MVLVNIGGFYLFEIILRIFKELKIKKIDLIWE